MYSFFLRLWTYLMNNCVGNNRKMQLSDLPSLILNGDSIEARESACRNNKRAIYVLLRYIIWVYKTGVCRTNTLIKYDKKIIRNIILFEYIFTAVLWESELKIINSFYVLEVFISEFSSSTFLFLNCWVF